MSTNILNLIPSKHTFIPDEENCTKANELLYEWLPNARKIELAKKDRIQFFDSGANLQTIFCPLCNQRIDIAWWQQAMNTAFRTDFEDLDVTTPCCQSNLSLNELIYDWPSGFARFVITIREPNGTLDDRKIYKLQHILRSTLRQVWTQY